MKGIEPYLTLYQPVRQNKPVGQQRKNPYIRKNKSNLIYIILGKCKQDQKRQDINPNDLIDHENNKNITISGRSNIEEPAKNLKT